MPALHHFVKLIRLDGCQGMDSKCLHLFVKMQQHPGPHKAAQASYVASCAGPCWPCASDVLQLYGESTVADSAELQVDLCAGTSV